jgi:hypothetical protein
MHFGGERADFRTKHGFKMSRIPVFPNSLQPTHLRSYFAFNNKDKETKTCVCMRDSV